MGFEMKGSTFYGKSPLNNDTTNVKTYPKGYTKEDKEFLEEQNEDIVRYEELDEEGKEIWRKQGKPVPNTK